MNAIMNNNDGICIECMKGMEGTRQTGEHADSTLGGLRYQTSNGN